RPPPRRNRCHLFVDVEGALALGAVGPRYPDLDAVNGSRHAAHRGTSACAPPGSAIAGPPGSRRERSLRPCRVNRTRRTRSERHERDLLVSPDQQAVTQLKIRAGVERESLQM